MLNFGHSKDLEATLVELKYADSKLSMVIVLPLKTSNLHQLEMNIKRHNLTEIFGKMGQNQIKLMLPKFKVEYGIELNDVLKQVCG